MQRRDLSAVARIVEKGIATDDAYALRRISVTLRRWFELECGNSDDSSSWTIARGRKDNGGAFEYDETGKPYLERHSYYGKETQIRYSAIPDRERGAEKRLAAILKRYPGWQAYIQSDPRGAALHLFPPGSLRPDDKLDEIYSSRGIAVY